MNNMELQMKQLMNNPEQFVKQAGWNIPPEIMGDPQKMVMHLIQTQAILDRLCEQTIEQLREQNQNLTNQLAMANLAASQTAQTQQIISALTPAA